jgi:hypothetical protein
MKRGWLLSLITLGSLFVGYVQAEAVNEAGDAAVSASSSWLALIDSGAYDQGYAAAAVQLRTLTNKAAWRQTIERAREGLGKVTTRKLVANETRTQLPQAPEGHYRIVQYETTFEGSKTKTEQVTLVEEGGVWRVAGYYIL